MNCSRQDHRRALDFSAIKDPIGSLGRAIQGLLSRRIDPMSAAQIARWFRATPDAFVQATLDNITDRGWICIIRYKRGAPKYWVR